MDCSIKIFPYIMDLITLLILIITSAVGWKVYKITREKFTYEKHSVSLERYKDLYHSVKIAGFSPTGPRKFLLKNYNKVFSDFLGRVGDKSSINTHGFTDEIKSYNDTVSYFLKRVNDQIEKIKKSRLSKESKQNLMFLYIKEFGPDCIRFIELSELEKGIFSKEFQTVADRGKSFSMESLTKETYQFASKIKGQFYSFHQ